MSSGGLVAANVASWEPISRFRRERCDGSRKCDRERVATSPSETRPPACARSRPGALGRPRRRRVFLSHPSVIGRLFLVRDGAEAGPTA